MQSDALSNERERLQLDSVLWYHLLPAGCRWPGTMKRIVTAVVRKGVCVCVCVCVCVYTCLMSIHFCFVYVCVRTSLCVSFGDLKNGIRLGHCLTQLLLLICIKYVGHRLVYNTHLLIT